MVWPTLGSRTAKEQEQDVEYLICLLPGKQETVELLFMRLNIAIYRLFVAH